MNVFNFPIVETLAAVSVTVTALSKYLVINKLWQRRHKKDVAESISIVAALLGLATGLPFLVKFTFIDHSATAALKSSVGMMASIVFIVIGSGFWVKEKRMRSRSFMGLMFKALKLERRESGYLFNEVFRPTGADRILSVLLKLARADRHLDEREVKFIKDFADWWHVELSDLESDDWQTASLLDVRNEVVQYLEMVPPVGQAAELIDLLRLLVEVDSEISSEEEMILEELDALIANYIEADEETTVHEVILVPQNDEQFEAVKTLLPDVEMRTMRNAKVFSAGYFFSRKYAEAVCDKYADLGPFATRLERSYGEIK